VGAKIFDGEGGVEGLNSASLAGLMNGPAVAAAIVNHVKDSELDNLSTVHVKLLAAATSGDLREGAEEWAKVYEALREHLIMKLCDAKHCEPVLATLSAFLLAPGVVQTPAELFTPGPDGQVAPLHGALSLLWPDGDVACQGAVYGFLGKLMRLRDTDFPVLLTHMLGDFKAASPDAFVEWH
jgi:hypothetical protein